jgi:hypothetical protein
MKPKTINILYWIFTVLFALAMLSTCIPSEEGTQMITGLLGYPPYFVNYIIAAKILGVVGILIPGFPRVKEWSYAGLFFDITSATYSFYAVGALAVGSLGMLIWFGLGIASYVFYHKKLKTVAA